jgi:DNA-directed RNA polymerase specialized sigma24 family protein
VIALPAAFKGLPTGGVNGPTIKTVVLGQTTAEVAEGFGMTRPVVRKAKSRTLRRLRQQLGDAD